MEVAGSEIVHSAQRSCSFSHHLVICAVFFKKCAIPMDWKPLREWNEVEQHPSIELVNTLWLCAVRKLKGVQLSCWRMSWVKRATNNNYTGSTWKKPQMPEKFRWRNRRQRQRQQQHGIVIRIIAMLQCCTIANDDDLCSHFACLLSPSLHFNERLSRLVRTHSERPTIFWCDSFEFVAKIKGQIHRCKQQWQ